MYGRLADITTTSIVTHLYGTDMEDSQFSREMMEQHGIDLGLLAAQLHPLQISCLIGAYLLNKYSSKRESPIKLGNCFLAALTIESLRVSVENFVNFLNYPPPFYF